MKHSYSLLLLVAIIIPHSLSAHSGGIDARGGHNCRTDCESRGYHTDQYHYHPEKMDTKQLEQYNSFKDRLCERVERRFTDNEHMLNRVNERIERRFGFTCNS